MSEEKIISITGTAKISINDDDNTKNIIISINEDECQFQEDQVSITIILNDLVIGYLK